MLTQTSNGLQYAFASAKITSVPIFSLKSLRYKVKLKVKVKQ